MNNARRKEILKVSDELEKLRDRVSELMDEEQEYFDNMPEGIQASEKGELSEQHLYALEEAVDTIDTAKEQLNEIAE
jgi:flagellar biosynthesis chaperone FliJ